MYGSVAERSKALVLGTSHFGGVGSNPTAASIVFSYIDSNLKILFVHRCLVVQSYINSFLFLL